MSYPHIPILSTHLLFLACTCLYRCLHSRSCVKYRQFLLSQIQKEKKFTCREPKAVFKMKLSLTSHVLNPISGTRTFKSRSSLPAVQEKRFMFEHRHLFESCLLGLLQAANSFIQGMKQQGLQSSQKCFPLAQRLFDFLPEAVLGRRGSAAHLGCQESDWGKRKIVYVRFLHRQEVRWRRLIAARNYNRGLFHWRARY